MNILKLAAQLTLDGRGFRAGMREAQSTAKSIGKEIGRDFTSSLAGWFGAGAMAAFVKSMISSVTHIKDMAEQFNATTDEVQELMKVGKEVGNLKFEDFGSALLRLGAARKDASTSNDKLLSIFNKYGISLKQLEDPTIRNIDLMKQLAESADKLTETDRQDFAELLGLKGQGGTRLIETLKELKNLGKIELINKDDIDNIDRATEALGELYRKIEAKAAKGVSASALFFSNLLDDHSNLPEKGMRKEFQGEGYLKFGKDEMGLKLLDDLAMSRRYGTQKEQQDQLEILQAYYNKKHGTSTKTGPQDDLIYGPPQEKPNEVSPETLKKIYDERDKLEKQLAESAVKYRLNEAKSEYSKRVILEQQLQEHAAKAAAQRAILGADGITPKASLEAQNTALEEDLKAMEILSQLAGMGKSGSLAVGSLTQSGVFGTGRNIITSQAESQTVKEIRALLGVNQKTAASTERTAKALETAPVLRVKR